ncbi:MULTISPECIES: CopG family transcriptional regulator [Halomicrobium]|uniref:CopG family protein n=2 Tax=Halomicrobium mukohataei TaxID=57705 RepID=C7P2W5_HALMD|nr:MULTISPECIES: CopG family transcriptional regulator [Halomicrobium]ACV47437.1 CopG family protein [Halomicrobium mukohataei DSM 12286]QCD65901.1 CopG family transcriptional regulator [Halomicrobium mukohataei]QFR20706.1 CopG family transcriptional regulator [Halomicrobium sp. ZPS1]
MPTRYTVVCDDDQVRAISRLAHRYGITEEEVLEQLLDLGLEAAEESTV